MMINRNLKLTFFLISPMVLQSADLYVTDYHDEADNDKFWACQRLMDASRDGNLGLVVSALENKIGVDIRDLNQNTPLLLAAKEGHGNVVIALLKANAAIEARDRQEMTPLALAAICGQGDVVNILLKSNAMVNVRNRKLNTPLHWSALDRDGNLEICNALLKAKAAVDVGNEFQDTPLHFAAEHGNIDIVIALLKAEPNIDLTLENMNLKTAFDLVNENCRRIDIAKKQAIIKAITDYRSLKLDAISKIICEHTSPRLFAPLARLIALYVFGEKDQLRANDRDSNERL